MAPAYTSTSWLLLAYQLPSRPSNARVATWRRLQRVGAVQVHGSVYVLPATAEAREDLEWIAEEVVGAGGQATLFVAETTEARARDEIVEAFRRSRAEEYAAIGAEARDAASAGARSVVAGSRRAPSKQFTAADRSTLATRLRERLAAVSAVDFFAAAGLDEAQAAIAKLENDPEDTMTTTDSATAGEPRLAARDFRERVWVTRPRPGIDRMSTAWLVRRFIDPEATFRFADPERRAEMGPSAVPFDMYGVELGHQRGGCTFETVVRRFAIGDPTVVWLARIVHQLDLKTAEPPAPEASTIGHLVEGLRRMYADDAELLERGMTMFEALYQSESERRSAPASPTAGDRRRAAKASSTTKPARPSPAKARPSAPRASGGPRSRARRKP